VDAHGFDEIDRRLLLTIMQKVRWRACGPSARWRHTGRRRDALEEVYEPFLIQIGFSIAPRAGAWPRGWRMSTLG
jgi:Holliday junction DNA helicase RuvB